MQSKEHWVEITDHPRYSVSSHGRIVDNDKGVVLRQTPSIGGRYMVRLVNHLGEKRHYVDRLVVIAFLDVDLEGYEIDHVDGDLKNNAVWNLEPVPKKGHSRRPVVNVDTGEVFPSIAAAAKSIKVQQGLIAYAIATTSRRVMGFRFELVDEDDL